jgi:hypothetical protein
MTRFHRLQLGLALLATAGLIVPPAAWAQGDGNDTQAATPAAAEEGNRTTGIIDVAMSGEGSSEGVLVDEQGNPIDAAIIAMYRGEEMVAEMTTDAEGRFGSSSLPAGVYRVVSPQGEATFRLWSHDAAPPTAITTAVLVNSSGVARAQLGILDPVGTSLILLGVTSVVLAAVTLGEVDSLEDDIDDINDLLSP